MPWEKLHTKQRRNDLFSKSEGLVLYLHPEGHHARRGREDADLWIRQPGCRWWSEKPGSQKNNV
jgi:hypothetical protein